MRNVSDSFSIDLMAEVTKVIELYVVDLPDGNSYYYTSGPDDFSWDHFYQAAPVRHGDMQFGLNFETDTVEIQLANISGDLVDVIQKNVLDAAVLTIKRVRANDSGYATNKEMVLFKGTADVEFDRTTMRLQVRSIFDSLNDLVPASFYEESSNWRVFDDNCALTMANYEYAGMVGTGSDAVSIIDVTRGTIYRAAFDGGDASNPITVGDALSGGGGGGTAVCVGVVYLTAANTTGFIWYAEQSGLQFVDDEVVTGGGNTVTINGTPAEDATYYEHGEIEFTSGANSGQRRPILTNAGSAVTLAWPVTDTPAAGDTYKITPGCDLTPTTCRDRFANETNYRGFLYIPKVEETLM